MKIRNFKVIKPMEIDIEIDLDDLPNYIREEIASQCYEKPLLIFNHDGDLEIFSIGYDAYGKLSFVKVVKDMARDFYEDNNYEMLVKIKLILEESIKHIGTYIDIMSSKK